MCSLTRVRPNHFVLPIILTIAAWALWPRTGDSETIRLGTDPAHVRNLPASVKYVLRVHPGTYLPGLMPENVGKPLRQLNVVAEEFEKLFPDTRIEYTPVP